MLLILHFSKEYTSYLEKRGDLFWFRVQQKDQTMIVIKCMASVLLVINKGEGRTCHLTVMQ